MTTSRNKPWTYYRINGLKTNLKAALNGQNDGATIEIDIGAVKSVIECLEQFETAIDKAQYDLSHPLNNKRVSSK